VREHELRKADQFVAVDARLVFESFRSSDQNMRAHAAVLGVEGAGRSPLRTGNQ
jgi:hypothetical protein